MDIGMDLLSNTGPWSVKVVNHNKDIPSWFT